MSATRQCLYLRRRAWATCCQLQSEADMALHCLKRYSISQIGKRRLHGRCLAVQHASHGVRHQSAIQLHTTLVIASRERTLVPQASYPMFLAIGRPTKPFHDTSGTLCNGPISIRRCKQQALLHSLRRGRISPSFSDKLCRRL